MSQQNPWKKQMMLNKNKVANESTVSNSKTNQDQTPPWMKKKQQQNYSNPPWMKKDQNDSSSTNNNQPSWMKNKQQTSAVSSNSVTNSTQPAWMKKQESQQGGNMPPWMQQKNSPASNQQSSNNPWKNNTSKLNSAKSKQQEEERLKKQEEERQRKEEQNRIMNERQAQYRQIKTMKIQDQLSARRQQKDKIQQQHRKALQEQKNKRNTKSKTPKPLVKQGRKKDCTSQVLFHRYLHYYEQSIVSDRALDYKQKLKSQNQMIKISQQFTSLMQSKIQQIVSNHKKFQNKKSKIISFPQLNALLHYGLCQGQQINQNSIRFDMKEIQRLEKVFKFYNTLNDINIGLSKKIPSFKLKAPLVCLTKFKGITFLCECISQQSIQATSSLPSQFKEIFNDYALLQKQLTQKHHYQVNKNDLAVKKMYIQALQEDIYIVCLKNWDIKCKEASLNEHSFDSQLDLERFVTDYYFLSKLELQKPSLIKQHQFSTFRKLKTDAFKTNIDIVKLAQSIFIVWSSCQGEVQENSFWDLVLSNSQDVWNLIKSTGYQGKLITKYLLFQIYELISGTKFDIKKNAFRKQHIGIIQSYCKTYNFSYRKLEINQIIRNFDKYLRENKLQLAQQSLQLMKGNFKNENQKRQLKEWNYILKKGSYLLWKRSFLDAIKLYEQTLQLLKDDKYNFLNIPLKIQLLAIYIQENCEERVLKLFSELLDIIQLYYGEETLIHATLYQMIGSYYSHQKKHKDDSEEYVIKFYQHAIQIVLKFYGDQSAQIAEVYMSRAISFLNLNQIDLFNKDIQVALKNYKFFSKYNNKIAECYLYKGKAKILEKKNVNQAIQLIEHASSIYIKISYYNEAIDALLSAVRIASDEAKKLQSIIQRIIQVCFDLKNVFLLKKSLTLIISKLDLDLKENLIRIKQKKQSVTQEKQNQDLEQIHNSILRLEEISKGFGSFIQMIQWLGFSISVDPHSSNSSLSQKNQELLSLLSKFFDINLIERQNLNKNEGNERQLTFQQQYLSNSNNTVTESPIKKFQKNSQQDEREIQNLQ